MEKITIFCVENVIFWGKKNSPKKALTIKKNFFRQWYRQVDTSRQLTVLPQLSNCRQSWQPSWHDIGCLLKSQDNPVFVMKRRRAEEVELTTVETLNLFLKIFLLWNDKTRRKEKTYICVSVWYTGLRQDLTWIGEYLNTWVEYSKFGVFIELSTTGGVVLNEFSTTGT